MHRLDRDTLYHRIHNVISCSRKKRRGSGRQIIASLESHEGQNQLAKLICDHIDNDSCMVIQAEFLMDKQRPGTWGIDEPVPATIPEPPKPRSYGGR